MAIGDWARRLRGVPRFVLALGLGLVSALAFEPYNLFPLLLVSLGLLILLLDGAQAESHPIRKCALIGWAYGFGQFAGGLYWIAYAFLVDPLDHAWQIPFVALSVPGGLALFVAAACAASAALWRDSYARVCTFAACYAIAEWLRGHILTGFPWNVAGYAWGASLSILQSASVIGIYGLTLLTLLLGASLALLCDRDRRNAIVPGVLTLIFAAVWVFGYARLATTPDEFVPGVRLRIVQPNIPQNEKYAADLRAVHWHELVGLSRTKSRTEPTIIVWPEAAPPFLLANEPVALDDIALLTPTKMLITGAVRAERTADGTLIAHNSIYMFAHGGRLIATYDKFHLVPFGEYAPFPKLLHALGIDRLVNQPGSFTPGDGPHTYEIPGAPPVGPLICYEILFPDEVTQPGHRPQWLVNVTDDSWFGPASSSGPYQHLLVARVRAIEQGLPVVRAANTGISAVIDPLGRVNAQLAVDHAGVIDAPLPRARSATIFAQSGDVGFLLLIVVSLMVGAANHIRRFVPRNSFRR
ncbi:MAG TPA: apolipoprotein N-acyltransferase [Rhizomicrobium sp.]|jgi:apolipoprotein N-acyltransferase